MSTARSKRRPSAVLGYLKAVWLLLAILTLLPVWLVRSRVARAKFRSELRAAGVPDEAARTLSRRYKLGVRDFCRQRLAA